MPPAASNPSVGVEQIVQGLAFFTAVRVRAAPKQPDNLKLL